MRAYRVGVVVAALVWVVSTSTAVAQPPAQGGLPSLAERVSALAAEVASLGNVPSVVPLAVRNLKPRGNAFGCSLDTGAFTEMLLTARCPTPGSDPVSGLAASLVTPPDMAYAYDGLYLCGVANNQFADRLDTNGSPLRVRLSIFFNELVATNGGGISVRNRDTSIDLTRRGLDFTVEVQQLRSLETDASTAGLRPCVVLPFAQGTQSGNQPRLPGDVYIPDTQVNIFISLPDMVPTTAAQFGDSLVISELGFTVAGRRPPQP
jgi:hypothetical protein